MFSQPVQADGFVQFNDGRRPGGRYPLLIAVRPDGSIEGAKLSELPAHLGVIAARKYVKNGQWSNTTFTIAPAPGVVFVEVCERLHEQPFEGFTSLAEAASALQQHAPLASIDALVHWHQDFKARNEAKGQELGPKHRGLARLIERTAALEALRPADEPERTQ